MKDLVILRCLKRTLYGMDHRANSIVVCTVLLLFCINDAFTSEFYADNGLQQTIAVDRIPGREKKEMQQEILTLLGLHHRPKPESHGFDNSAPQFMLDLYNKIRVDDVDGSTDGLGVFNTNDNITVDDTVRSINGTDIIMSFVNHASKKAYLRHEKDRTFYFDFSEVSPEERVTSAELRLYKDPPKKEKRGGECLVEILTIHQGVDPEDKILEHESNLTVAWNYEGWIKLNVTHAADMWNTFSSTNLGLYMRITDIRKGKHIDPDKFGIVGRKGPESKHSFMVGFFKMSHDLHIRRTRSIVKRSAPNTSRPEDNDDYYVWGGGSSYSVDRYNTGPCQRHTLFVSFQSLGWQEWIIAPEGYPAFFCGGVCNFPLGSHMNATNHAIVQTLVHLMKPMDVPKPCCAPTKLSGISVLYFDEKSNVVLKIYKHMVVKACGCH